MARRCSLLHLAPVSSAARVRYPAQCRRPPNSTGSFQITAISVLSPFRVVRHRLSSPNLCMGSPSGSHQRRWMQYPRRRPIASSLEALGDVDRLVMGPSSETLHMCGHAHAGALLPRPTVDRRHARVDRLNLNLVRSATPSNICGQPLGLHQSAICQPRVWCFAYTTCCGAREIASRLIC